MFEVFFPPPHCPSSILGFIYNFEACTFNKRYMPLFETTFWANAFTSMKSNHLLDMGALKSVRWSKLDKEMLISMLLKPAGKMM